VEVTLSWWVGIDEDDRCDVNCETSFLHGVKMLVLISVVVIVAIVNLNWWVLDLAFYSSATTAQVVMFGFTVIV